MLIGLSLVFKYVLVNKGKGKKGGKIAKLREGCEAGVKMNSRDQLSFHICISLWLEMEY